MPNVLYKIRDVYNCKSYKTYSICIKNNENDQALIINGGLSPLMKII